MKLAELERAWVNSPGSWWFISDRVAGIPGPKVKKHPWLLCEPAAIDTAGLLLLRSRKAYALRFFHEPHPSDAHPAGPCRINKPGYIVPPSGMTREYLEIEMTSADLRSSAEFSCFDPDDELVDRVLDKFAKFWGRAGLRR
jgi:hypothetical protein